MTKQSATPKGDLRRTAVLDAARSCFIANGFQAASMQDILAAAQLSAGAFYRYFPSKEKVVEAVVKTVLAEIKSAFDDVVPDGTESLSDTMTKLLLALEALDSSRHTSSIALQAWAETQRNTGLAEYVHSEMRPLIRWFEDLVKLLQKQKKLPVSPPRRIALALMGSLQGFVVQKALLNVDAAGYGKGLAALFG